MIFLHFCVLCLLTFMQYYFRSAAQNHELLCSRVSLKLIQLTAEVSSSSNLASTFTSGLSSSGAGLSTICSGTGGHNVPQVTESPAISLHTAVPLNFKFAAPQRASRRRTNWNSRATTFSAASLNYRYVLKSKLQKISNRNYLNRK